jgi:hypothetical protein
MVTTRVTWIYPTATVEQRQEIANYVAGYESNTNSALMDELNAKAIELANGDTTVGSSYDIEEDIANQIHRHTRTRSWPDLATAQEWVTFVLSKGAESAVVVEE